MKKRNMYDILVSDLNEIRKDRDDLLEELKLKVIVDKELDFMMKTICTQNAIIMELENNIKKYEGSK